MFLSFKFQSPFLSPSCGASNLTRDKKYGHLESAAAARQQRELSPTNRLRGDSINGRYSSDPVKYTRNRGNDLDSVFKKFLYHYLHNVIIGCGPV